MAEVCHDYPSIGGYQRMIGEARPPTAAAPTNPGASPSPDRPPSASEACDVIGKALCQSEPQRWEIFTCPPSPIEGFGTYLAV